MKKILLISLVCLFSIIFAGTVFAQTKGIDLGLASNSQSLLGFKVGSDEIVTSGIDLGISASIASSSDLQDDFWLSIPGRVVAMLVNQFFGIGSFLQGDKPGFFTILALEIGGIVLCIVGGIVSWAEISGGNYPVVGTILYITGAIAFLIMEICACVFPWTYRAGETGSLGTSNEDNGVAFYINQDGSLTWKFSF
jgi:hypothetical protein